MKKFSILALAMVAGASWAQLPTAVKHVKTINVPVISNVSLLDGQGILAIGVSGNTAFYSGFRTGGFGDLVLVKVTGIDTPAPVHTVIATVQADANRASRIVIEDGATPYVWWMTNAGGGVAGVNPTQIRKYDFNGNLQTTASGRLADGIVTMTELALDGVSLQDMALDPGFNGSGNRALCLVNFGNRLVRRYSLTDFASIDALGAAAPAWPTGVRGITFDGNGNVFWKDNANSIFFSARTSDAGNGGGTAGLDNGSATAFASMPTFGGQAFQYVHFVPASGANPAMLVSNDRSVADTQGRMQWFNADTGASLGSNTAAGTTPFARDWMSFANVVLGGTRYVLGTSFNGGTQGVNLWQVGEDGRISGTINLGDWNPAEATHTTTVFLDVIDANDGTTVLDTRSIGVVGAGPAGYTFYTMARGNVIVKVRSAGWLTKSAATATAGSTAITASATLRNGDINADNEVGAADFSALAAQYDAVWDSFVQTYAQWLASDAGSADINGDGEVGAADFSILAANYDEVGD